MLTQEQLNQIRENLEASQNPLFFFDNDVDGLMSFLILRRAIGRGKGVAIKSFPDLKEQYVKKVEELNPDAVFILDKAELSKEFADGYISYRPSQQAGKNSPDTGCRAGLLGVSGHGLTGK